MAGTWPDKDPNAVLDYQIDWTDWLNGDTIDTSAWTVPAGITKDSESNTTTATVIWLSGGTEGETYEILNRITTAGGRTQDKTMRITISER